MQMIVVPYSPASMKADFGGWQFQSRFQMGFNEEFLNGFLFCKAVDQFFGSKAIKNVIIFVGLRNYFFKKTVLPVSLGSTIAGGIDFIRSRFFRNAIADERGCFVGRTLIVGINIKEGEIKLFAVVVTEVRKERKAIKKGKAGIEIINDSSREFFIQFLRYTEGGLF